jgi:uncharacterized RDD family membrane protein YckC
MKCPKCGYLGFEEVDHCRNCGYQFSLAARAPMPDLSLNGRDSDSRNPMEDLSFLQEIPGQPAVATPPPDLPLFSGPGVDDEPLITRVSPPRQPLAVRRATPELPRLRGDTPSQSFDLVFEPEAAPPPPAIARRQAERPLPDHTSPRSPDGSSGNDLITADAVQDAGLAPRFLACALDVCLMVTVDVLVVYFTMAISGVGLLEFGVLPKVPLLTFLALQNGAYLVGFTAGGQTLGQMALGLRVVTADHAAPLGVGRALNRTLMWALLALPAGLGFLTAVFAPDRRGLHDRLAGSRVIRGPA